MQLALLNPSWTGPKSSAWNPCGEAGDAETESLLGVEKLQPTPKNGKEGRKPREVGGEEECFPRDSEAAGPAGIMHISALQTSHSVSCCKSCSVWVHTTASLCTAVDLRMAPALHTALCLRHQLF